MPRQGAKDPTGGRELLVMVGGGLLVLVCCAAPALLAAGVLGALGAALRGPALLGMAVLAVGVGVGVVALRRASRDRRQSCRPPPERTGDHLSNGGGEPAGPHDRRE